MPLSFEICLKSKCNMYRNAFFILISLFYASIVKAQLNKNSPNIILIMADDLGYSDIGCYGSEIPTPNIDMLAKNGVRFSQFYNTARCCPTRASLLTGLFQHEAGVGTMAESASDIGHSDLYKNALPAYQGYLNNNCVTMAEVLKLGGYHTYMTGKWHLGMFGEEKWPVQRGFEKYYGILAGATSYFRPNGPQGLFDMNTKLKAPEGKYYTTDAFTDSAITFINGKKDKKPFFLYLAYNAPHWPLQAKPTDIKKFEGVYSKGWDKIREARFEKQLRLGILDKNTQLSPRDPAVRAWDKLTPQQQTDLAYRMSVYAAQISSLDQNVGKLMASLKAQGKLENTLIIFLSDNGACGEPAKDLGGGKMSDINNPMVSGPVSYGIGWANASNTPYRKWKVFQNEGGIRAPFIAYWPQQIKTKNAIIGTPSYLIDVMPTFLQVSGVEYPKTYKGNQILALPGRSFKPAFSNNKVSEQRICFGNT